MDDEEVVRAGYFFVEPMAGDADRTVPLVSLYFGFAGLNFKQVITGDGIRSPLEDGLSFLPGKFNYRGRT